MSTQFAPVAFVNNADGAWLEGKIIADTGPTWMIHVEGYGVRVLQKTEWTSAPVRPVTLDDIFGGVFA